MCVIVDADSVGSVFSDTPAEHLVPLANALRGRSRYARAAVGGQLLVEYLRLGPIRRLLPELLRSGIVRRVPDDVVEIETATVAPSCVSDDPHVIGLARIAGVRILVTADRDLMSDFKDASLISKPRGSVYTRPSHVRLVRLACKNIR